MTTFQPIRWRDSEASLLREEISFLVSGPRSEERGTKDLVCRQNDSYEVAATEHSFIGRWIYPK
jgi:hypothetical protein